MAEETEITEEEGIECLGCGEEVNGNGIRLKALSSQTIKDDVYLNLIFSKTTRVCNAKCAGRAVEQELALRISDLVTSKKTDNHIAKLI